MITLHLRGEDKLYKSLIRIERNVATSTVAFVDFTADWLVSDIRKHWSISSPSTRGNAPAKKTGNLDSSVKVAEGRDTKGRFAAGNDITVRFVRIDTADGDNPMKRGNYSQALEDKNYLNRPFLAPAVERMRSAFPTLAKSKIKT